MKLDPTCWSWKSTNTLFLQKVSLLGTQKESNKISKYPKVNSFFLLLISTRIISLNPFFYLQSKSRTSIRDGWSKWSTGVLCVSVICLDTNSICSKATNKPESAPSRADTTIRPWRCNLTTACPTISWPPWPSILILDSILSSTIWGGTLILCFNHFFSSVELKLVFFLKVA